MPGRPGRAALVLALATSAAGAQEIVDTSQIDRYEMQFGRPVDVSLSDFLFDCAQYEGRAVRTRGTLEMGDTMRSYVLRDRMGGGARLIPVAEAEASFESDARRWFGKELQVTGLAGRASGTSSQALAQMSPCFIQFWKYVGPVERESKGGPLKADTVSLEDLLARPGKLDGKTVRVVGKFRGRNLFGDLPARSERESSDWVIKDDLFAVWVTGKRPKGPGWELDASLRRDTNKWIEVVGRPETVGNVTYIRALEVNLSAPPTATAAAAPPPPPPQKPKVPPVIVFSLPLDGERDVPSTGVFKVQFSKDMDEDSFRGRVLFRYAGPRLPGDRDFVGLKLSYDGGRRALIVDPGDVLRAGRVVEIRLLAGIVDMDGLPLGPRPGRESTAATADMLRFEVAASTAFLPGS
jgi:hypothetical protein